MAHFLAGLYSSFAIFPFISFFIVLLIALIITKNKKESFRWAIHITMLFLLSSVATMMHQITGSMLGFWLMIIFLLILGGLIGWLQWKKRNQILLPRILRAIWMLGFILFSFTYIILFFIGIIQQYGQT